MKNKTENLYTKIFTKIKDITGIKPNLVINDLEKALSNVVEREWNTYRIYIVNILYMAIFGFLIFLAQWRIF